MKISSNRITRRDLLKRMGGGSALLATGLAGGLTAGCERKPRDRIVSFSQMPEYQKPGQAIYYAATWTEGEFPYGMLVKTVEGRPIAVEGNPQHPINRGASNSRMQSSVMALYDPDRLRSPLRDGKPVSWEEADQQIIEALREAEKVALITRSTLGPSERALAKKFLEAKPGAKHFVYELVHDGPRRKAWDEIYGAGIEARPRFDKAEIILSLGCDFLGTEGPALEAIRQFIEGRKVKPDNPAMSRLYVVEGDFTLTGSNADHRIALRPTRSLDLARALLAALRGEGDGKLDAFAESESVNPKVLKALSDDLRSHREKSLVVAGAHLPESVHAAVALLNDALGAPGRTLELAPQTAQLPVNDLKEIEDEINEGLDLLLCLGVNPGHESPNFANLTRNALESGRWADHLPEVKPAAPGMEKKVKLAVGHGLFETLTLQLSDLALPSAHNLESWNDAEPRPGLKSLCQPVIAPLFNGRQEVESLFLWTKALLPDDAELKDCPDWHGFLQGQWKANVYPSSGSPVSFDAFWRAALQEGVFSSPAPKPDAALSQEATERLAAVDIPQTDGIEIVVRPHQAYHDDRFDNIAWLQELPDPITKRVWGNAIAASPETVKGFNDLITDSDRKVFKGLKAEDIFLPQPGMADGVLAMTFGGGGRWVTPPADASGGYAAAMAIRKMERITPWLAAADGIAIEARHDSGCRILSIRAGQEENARFLAMYFVGDAYPTKKAADLPDALQGVSIQRHPSQEGRPIVLEGTLEEYKRDPRFVEHLRHLPKPAKIHQEFDYSMRNKWGMAIDLARCVGCANCVVACQAENNVPAVGKTEAAKGREMHWLRIDRYYVEDESGVRILHQPVTCQHCENAPCENVCPVAATTHSPNGLNEMTYNRCVGTRYCSNNCPYKVRRFNFHNYPERFIGPNSHQRLAYNPQVTVRSVGVMEKCTFCVQRITEARYKSKRDALPHPSGSKIVHEIPDGTLRTACQQACPAGAIVFGDLNDPESEVAKWAASERAYMLLEELHTKPRIRYLAKVRNPHPDLAGTEGQKGHQGH